MLLGVSLKILPEKFNRLGWAGDPQILNGKLETTNVYIYLDIETDEQKN